MAHYGTLGTHNYSIAEGEDIRGANVYGTDGDKLWSRRTNSTNQRNMITIT